MFLRSTKRWKDGKAHYYWSLVENRRCRGGRVIQQTGLLFGGDQRQPERAMDSGELRSLTRMKAGANSLKLFAAERPWPENMPEGVRVRLKDFELRRPRQWGGCWLFCRGVEATGAGYILERAIGDLSRRHQLGARARSLELLSVVGPGAASGGCTAVGLINRPWAICWREDFSVAAKDTLYRCLDRLLEHKEELFGFLRQRWKRSLWGEVRGAAL